MSEDALVEVVVNGHRGQIKAGSSLLMAAYRVGAKLYYPCGGEGACSACRVRVIEGAESLSSESGFMRVWRGLHLSLSAEVRLACQTSVVGPGPVIVEGVFSKR